MKYFVQNKKSNYWQRNWVYRFEILDYSTAKRTFIMNEGDIPITNSLELSFHDHKAEVTKVRIIDDN